MSAGWTGGLDNAEVESTSGVSAVAPSFDVKSRYVTKSGTQQERNQRSSNFSWGNRNWGEELTQPPSLKRPGTEGLSSQSSSVAGKPLHRQRQSSDSGSCSSSFFSCLENTAEVRTHEVLEVRFSSSCIPFFDRQGEWSDCAARHKSLKLLTTVAKPNVAYL